MDFDRVMVLERGRVKEFDSPAQLLRTNGAFSALVAEAGPATADALRAIAMQAEVERLARGPIVHSNVDMPATSDQAGPTVAIASVNDSDTIHVDTEGVSEILPTQLTQVCMFAQDDLGEKSDYCVCVCRIYLMVLLWMLCWRLLSCWHCCRRVTNWARGLCCTASGNMVLHCRRCIAKWTRPAPPW